MRKALKLFLVIYFISNQINAQTTIPDNSNVSGNWTLANSPYIILGRAIVPNGQTLIIDPGVEIRFQSSTSSTPTWFNYASANVGVLRIQGKIIANGTTNSNIRFTRNSAGHWGTILLDQTADPTSSFQHCIIEYGKYTRNVTGISSVVSFDAGLSFYRSTANVSQNSFRFNNTAGVGYWETSNALLNNNHVYGNETNGIYSFKSQVEITNNTIYDNSYGATGNVSAITCANSNNRIIGNLLYNNDDFGIYLIDSTNLIVNNTIYNHFQGIRIESNGDCNIYNTIVAYSTNSNFATSGAGTGIINLYNSLTTASTLPANVNNITGNLINTNPLVQNATLMDFTLSNLSPCINAGNPSSSGLFLPLLDLSGNPRISGSAIDIGAFEKTSTSGTINISECDIYTSPSGNYTWNSSGVYLDTIPNSAGLDSVITVNLTINYSSASSINTSTCNNYIAPDGQVYNTSGIKTAIIPNASGCDSTITINLTINTVDTSVIQNGITLTADASGADYQWLDCNNANSVIIGETNQSYTATQIGSYAVKVTQNGCIDTSFCYTITTVGILESNFDSDITIYPNPSDGIVKIDLGEIMNEFTVVICDVSGKLIYQCNYKDTEIAEINLNVPQGFYLLTIISGTKTETIRLMRN